MDVEHIEKDFKALVEGEADLLNLVVKFHFSIDKVLDRALYEALPMANAMELRRVSFLLKFDFLSALNVLSRDVRKFFDYCNSIRNTFAHNPYATFQDKDVVKAKGLLLSHPRPVVPKTFLGEKDSVEVLKTLFSVCFLQAVVAYEALCRQKVLNLITSEMTVEAATGKGRKFQGKMSVNAEFERRCVERLSVLYPAIEPGDYYKEAAKK
ncbi:hypothetical protein [Pseudomonas fluorescens]|uniref:Uncharacterized protein n=1 Tax=Pseudomonas fluorescens TaxID=294 RepID=A0A7Z3C7G8_PSEFL|nr:hypothetical protein [Pseudomonas fluorescens]QJP96543.1 hypothetical protein C6Y56_18930 [Pseudomonas fluorescens]